MELNFHFTSDKSSYPGEESRAINVNGRTLGLDDVDTIRKYTKEQTPLDNINSTMPRLLCNVSIPVDEKTAREIPPFKKVMDVYVRVEDGGLNKYTKEVVCLARDGVTEEILQAKMLFDTEKDRILADWMAAGCPLYWV